MRCLFKILGFMSFFVLFFAVKIGFVQAQGQVLVCEVSFKDHQSAWKFNQERVDYNRVSDALKVSGWKANQFSNVVPLEFEIEIIFHHARDITDKMPQEIQAMIQKSGGKVKSCRRQNAFPETSNDLPVARKPLIYLYPPNPQEVLVQLDYQGRLTADYPDYDEILKGWKVFAYPDGRLINKADGQEYSYLFWEGIPYQPIQWDQSQGFVVAGSDTKAFLQKTLRELGLTPKEYNEFIVYWLPQLKHNPYNYIYFAGLEYTQTAPLYIQPKPDSLLRVFMIFQKLETPRLASPQKLQPFNRKGFTVVEWGGMEWKEGK